MIPCACCRGFGTVVPAMSPETLAAFAAVGGCFDRVPCPVCSAVVGALTLADPLAGAISSVLEPLLEIVYA